jgi:predicted ATPase
VGDPLPPVTLKGIAGPVVIVNVREMRRGAWLRPLPRPLLGREAEQAHLAAALDKLLSGETQGSAWLVSGETGLGKTTLMAHLAEMARQHGLTVLAAQCQPHSKHLPLFTWIDLLLSWLDFDQSNDPGLQRVRLEQELASLDLSNMEKVLANLLALPAIDTFTPGGGRSSSAQMTPSAPANLLSLLNTKTQASQPAPARLQNLLQDRLAGGPDRSEKTLWARLEERVSGPHALMEWLKKLAQREPVVIILEDIDWIDQDSATLLANLLPRLTHLSLLLLLTRRESTNAYSQVSPLPLSRLTDELSLEVAQRALGAHGLDEPLTRWICRRAGGNPLYVEELCQALQQAEAVLLDQESGRARWIGLEPALPLSLHGLLLARLDELSLTCQNVLKRAAVLGQMFEVEALIKLCQPQINALDVTAALEEATRASFLTALQTTTYQFNHPLMQEAIYTTLAFSQRQGWHTKMGDWLVESRPETDQNMELIAYHYLQGADGVKAARFGRRAGDKARAQGLYAGAAEYYAKVLALAHAPPEEQAAAAEGQVQVLALQNKIFQ